jgi:hypothetical protein
MADPGDGEIRFCETIDLIQIQGEGLFIWETIWNDAMSTGRTLGRQMFGSDVRFRCSVQGRGGDLTQPRTACCLAMLLLSISRPPTNLTDY